MLLSIVSVESFAHDIEVANDDGVTIYYKFKKSNTELAVSCRGNSYFSYSDEYSGDVVIPESVTYDSSTYPVTSIEDWAFYQCTGLTSVTIGNNVTTIDDYAFGYCSGLTSVVIPNSITSISDNSFRNCSGLKSVSFHCEKIGSWFSRLTTIDEVTIGNEVKYIGGGAFDGCSGLTSIIIPNSVVNIGGYAFSNCTGITSLVIPNSVTSIESGAFSGCTGLASITIPNSVMSIGESAFSGCSNLSSIDIPDGVTSIKDKTFQNCIGLKSINIPNSVMIIGDIAFSGCRELTSITIPNGVTSIGYMAFENCSKLATIIIPNSVTNIRSVAFHGTSWYENQPNGVVYAGKVVYSYKGNMLPNANIVLDEGTLGIAGGAFYNNSNLTTITIPNSVTTIGENAFYGTAWYNNLPNGVVYAGKVVYKYKGTLPSNANIVLDEGTLGIAGGAFGGYSSPLTSITIPGTVTNIGDGAFSNCGSLTSITIPGSVTSIGRNAFNNCGLTSINFPNSVTCIGYYSFEGCIGLTSLIIPRNLLYLGDGAFSRCSGLTSVFVESDSPVAIDPYTFTNKNNATLYVPNGSKYSYSSVANWKDFGKIKEYPNNDVNDDGETDVVDVVDIARYVVGTPSALFDEFVADLDGNGTVNIADAIVLVNDIAGDTNFARGRAAASQNQSDNVLSLNGDGSNLSLQMEGNDRFAAFQFDLWLPSDMDVMEFSLNDVRRQGHQLLYNKIGDGHYRVVALSTSGNAFNGTSGELLGITLDNFANEGVYIDNIHFVTPAGIDVPFEPVRVSYTTGIYFQKATNNDNQTVYNLNGLRLNSPQKGLNIMGGKKIVVK